MCGITGIFDLQADQSLVHVIERMTHIVNHRGPDDQGVFVDSGIALGMRRLSIIDVAGGNQPIFNEDSSLVIVFNGEIYNYQALRAQLEPNHQFASASDTEAVLHLYEEYGVEALQQLRGMFALAIWDANRRELFIARDRLGIKPLYYSYEEGRLIFGSEIKSILEHPSVARRVNVEALNMYLSLQYVPGPETMFQGISKLPPGHYMVVSAQGLTVRSYWQLPAVAEQTRRSTSELARDLIDELRETVRLHLISDVPLGAFLSGGIDSSVVVALMSQLLKEPVQTFSVGFDAGGSAYNETQYARRVAGLLGTNHHELVVDSRALRLLPQLVWHLDEPLADRAALPTYLVSRLARRHVTVALTGEGGDELFAGYRRYQALALAQAYQYVPKPLRQGIDQVVGRAVRKPAWTARYKRIAQPDLFQSYIGQQSNFAPTAKKALLAPELRAAFKLEAPFDSWGVPSGAGWLGTLLYRDATTWLPDDLLMKADKMSMAASLEARVPFLDHRLVEWVSDNVPLSLRLHRLTSKYILKQAAGTLLPHEIITRRKQGFDVPLAQWAGANREFVTELLTSPRALDRGYFDPQVVRTLVAQTLSPTGASPAIGGQLWSLICFELWHRLFIDRDESWLDGGDVDEYLDRQQVLFR